LVEDVVDVERLQKINKTKRGELFGLRGITR
jgi:hypothetical protein